MISMEIWLLISMICVLWFWGMVLGVLNLLVRRDQASRKRHHLMGGRIRIRPGSRWARRW